jgi:4-amino-4-deoxy-L-arabinose transferase-like glycosyltransferase
LKAFTVKFLAFLRANWALLIPALAYLWIFPYLPDLRSPNELCRLHQTRALVDHHTLEINQVLREQGYVGDLSCVAIARDSLGKVVARRSCPEAHGEPSFTEKHYFPSKAPLLSFMAAPVYAVLKALFGRVPEVALVFFARLFCTILPALLALIFVRRFLRAQLEPPIADALTVAYALGSLAFSYSELFMSHQTTAVALFLCFYALWRLRRGEWPSWTYLIAGLFAGLTVAAEYTGALGLIPLAVYGLWTAPGGAKGKSKAAALAIAGVLPVALLLAWYHQAAFGSPFATGYKYLNDAAYQGWHRGGFLGIRLPDARAFVLSFFSPLRGLFTLAPFLLLALPGFAPRFWTRERRPELALCLATLALYAYFTSSFSYDSWGWTTGPRHLTSLVPFLLLPAGLFVQAARERLILGGASAGLVGASILATSAMTFLNYIPDSLTNALYQVALPLLAKGFLPHSLLSLAGVPNPWAALPAVIAVLAALVLALRALLPDGKRLPSAAVAVVVAGLLMGLHASVRPQGTDRQKRDQGTYEFLQQRYVPRPGEASAPLWGAGRER